MLSNASTGMLRLGSRTVLGLSSSSTMTITLRCQSTLKDSYANILVASTPQTGVAVITLNRPKALNALSDALFQDLLHASRALEDDPSIGCLVLTGSAKAFAAGADISEMQSKTFEQVYEKDWISEWQSFSSQTSKPVIAAVSGYCLGGGCELAMMCDIILCSESAKFGQPEINLGVIPGAGGTQRLTKMIGKSKAMHLCLTGDFLKAQEAYASGLVAKVYTDDELLPKSVEMAEKIASKGRLSVKACKEAVKAADELPLQEGLRLERRLFQSLFATDDQKEGMNAFLEKREAQFKKY
jgi:enoyl-CoA hydratase/carnithine racemase